MSRIKELYKNTKNKKQLGIETEHVKLLVQIQVKTNRVGGERSER